MVGFDEEALHAGDVVDDGMVGVAEVGENPEGRVAAPEDEAHRVGGIVRHGKGGDFQRADGEARTRGEEPPVGGGIARVLSADFVGREPGGVDGAAQGGEEDGQSAGVVAVLVGEEDSIDGRGVDADGVEAGEGFAGAEAGIEKQGGVAGPDHGGVAVAAAAEDDQFHGAQRSGRADAGQRSGMVKRTRMR